MDSRRLDTAGCLAAGVLGIPAPTTDIPRDREEVDGAGDGWCFIGIPAVVEALEVGKVVSASNYYGLPYVWKVGDGLYRGTLLQYRAVTEAPTFTTAEDAAEWFEDTYHATDG